MHAHNSEAWTIARFTLKRDWTPAPRHARGGRHADPKTRRGRKVLAKVFGFASNVLPTLPNLAHGAAAL